MKPGKLQRDFLLFWLLTMDCGRFGSSSEHSDFFRVSLEKRKSHIASAFNEVDPVFCFGLYWSVWALIIQC